MKNVKGLVYKNFKDGNLEGVTQGNMTKMYNEVIIDDFNIKTPGLNESLQIVIDISDEIVKGNFEEAVELIKDNFKEVQISKIVNARIQWTKLKGFKKDGLEFKVWGGSTKKVYAKSLDGSKSLSLNKKELKNLELVY